MASGGRREWLLVVGSVTLALVVSLGLLRWFAPQLLGLPAYLDAPRAVPLGLDPAMPTPRSGSRRLGWPGG